MNALYPIYQYSESDAQNEWARVVRLDNLEGYPFDHFHAHAYNEIMVFIKGGGRHNINFIDHPVVDNAIHLLAAHDLHWLERARSSAGFAIVYKDQLLHKLQMVHPEIPFPTIFGSSQILNLSDEDAAACSFLFQEILAHATPSAYMLQIISAFMTKIALLQSPTSIAPRVYDPIIATILKLITLHYKEKKPLAFYASQLHLSPKTLQNRIKKATASTLNALVQDYRLKEAKKLLCTTDGSIFEIALELGFNETAHFTHWFKKATSILPHDYNLGT